MKGSYILLLELGESQYIPVGQLGVLYFTEGFYAYVGSALNGIETRVERHFRRNKKHHWHIDYVLDRASIYEVVLVPVKERLECTLARALKEELLCIRRFGSSDCRCPGHLFYATGKNELNVQVAEVLANLGINYYRHLSRRAIRCTSRSCSSSLFSSSSRFWRHARHSLALTSRGGWKRKNVVTSPWNLPPQVRHSHSSVLVSFIGFFSTDDDCEAGFSRTLDIVLKRV